MSGEDRFDGLFLNVAQQAQGIEPLLDHLFGFLRRKTDFFSGASSEEVEAVVIKAVRKHNEKHEKEEKERKKNREKEVLKKKKAAEAAAAKKAKEANAAAASATKSFADAATKGASAKDDDVLEMNDDGSFDTSVIKKVEKLPTKTVQLDSNQGLDQDSAQELANADLTPEEIELKEQEEKEDKEPAPIGNGGTVEGKYTWTQTLQDLQVNAPLPPGTSAKMLNVEFSNTKWKVGLKGKEPLFEGQFHKRIKVEDSFWTVEDGELVFSLQKDDKMTWWKCVTIGDPEINTQKVQPENSKLADLDGETRQTVEKMMFDQRQKAAGKPTSDELSKQEMLSKFMKQHPEMDFSNAKFS